MTSIPGARWPFVKGLITVWYGVWSLGFRDLGFRGLGVWEALHLKRLAWALYCVGSIAAIQGLSSTVSWKCSPLDDVGPYVL